MLTHFVYFIVEKSNLSPPVQCWSKSCCQNAWQIRHLWLMGWGRIMKKSRTSAFYWTMSCPIFYFSGNHGIVVINCIRCANCFFSMTVESSWKFCDCFNLTVYMIMVVRHIITIFSIGNTFWLLYLFCVLSQNYWHFFEKIMHAS